MSPVRAATPTRFRKVHISLPEDVYAYVEGRRSESGAPFSTMVSDLLRKERAAEEQERLDQALTLDAEAHLAFARATASTSSRIVGSAEAAAPEP